MRLVIAGTTALALLVGCGANAQPPQQETPPKSPTQQSEPAPEGGVTSLVTWGDSLTAGSGGDGTTYPDVLAELTGVPVYNLGVPGERSSGIAARQGGVPAPTTVVGGSIPAEGGIEVQFGGDVVIIRDDGSLRGTLAGVHGTLTKDQSRRQGKYTFTRDTPGEITPVPDGSPFVTDIAQQYRDAGTIIWSGHNDIALGDGSRVLDNIAGMVDFVQSAGHYLVLGLSNGTGSEKGTPAYDEGILGINTTLEETYGPDHYLDVRRFLIEDGLRAAGIEPTRQDLLDIGNDIPPSSLRDTSAQGHLNAIGYRVLAEYINQFITDQGWV